MFLAGCHVHFLTLANNSPIFQRAHGVQPVKPPPPFVSVVSGASLVFVCKVITLKPNSKMFIEKFTLKNNNAQCHRICVSVFLAKSHLITCSL